MPEPQERAAAEAEQEPEVDESPIMMSAARLASLEAELGDHEYDHQTQPSTEPGPRPAPLPPKLSAAAPRERQSTEAEELEAHDGDEESGDDQPTTSSEKEESDDDRDEGEEIHGFSNAREIEAEKPPCHDCWVCTRTWLRGLAGAADERVQVQRRKMFFAAVRVSNGLGPILSDGMQPLLLPTGRCMAGQHHGRHLQVRNGQLLRRHCRRGVVRRVDRRSRLRRRRTLGFWLGGSWICDWRGRDALAAQRRAGL